MNTPVSNRFEGRDDDAQYHEEWLSAYLDDQLSPAQRRLVEQHIAADPEASPLLNDLERIRSLVGSLPGWSGRKLQVPVEGLPIPHGTGESPVAADAGSRSVTSHSHSVDFHELDSQLLLTSLPEDDFHDELQPVVEQVSTLGTAAPPSVKLPGSNRGGSPGSLRSWWRPLSLAASLLFAVGLALLLWPTETLWNVASSSRMKDAPPADSERHGTQSESSKAADEGAAADGAQEALNAPADSATTPGAGAAVENSLKVSPSQAQDQSAQSSSSYAAPGPELSEPAADGLAGTAARGRDALRSRALQNFDNQRSDFAPATRSQEAPPTPSNAESVGGEAAAMSAAAPLAASSVPYQSPAPQEPQALGKAAAAQTTLQIAHSTAWQESEIGAGLARLQPLLNLYQATPSAQVVDKQASATSAPQASPAQASPNIPVAVLSVAAASGGVQQLTELLQQSNVELTGIAAPAATTNLSGIVPYGTDSSQAPSTIALFVNREQAGEILQAAGRLDNATGPPVWIRSATDSAATLDDEQQVIVVFSPQ